MVSSLDVQIQPHFMGQLLTELAGEDRDPQIRILAGLHFKNLLDAKVPYATGVFHSL